MATSGRMFGSGIALGICFGVALWIAVGRAPATSVDGLPRIEILTGSGATQPSFARAGDRVRFMVPGGAEARIYRADRLVVRCPGPTGSILVGASCRSVHRAHVVEATLATPGTYQLVETESAIAQPGGSLEADLEAIVQAGGNYEIDELHVR